MVSDRNSKMICQWGGGRTMYISATIDCRIVVSNVADTKESKYKYKREQIH